MGRGGGGFGLGPVWRFRVERLWGLVLLVFFRVWRLGFPVSGFLGLLGMGIGRDGSPKFSSPYS